jgi:hypothetical protein
VVISAPGPSPTPSPVVTLPKSLSPREREAAESAIEAYRQFLAVYDQALQAGGVGAEELLSTAAVQTALSDAVYDAGVFHQKRWHLVGDTRMEWARVRSVSMRVNPKTYTVPEVVLDTCLTVTGLDVTDAAGASVRPKDAPDHWNETAWIRYYPELDHHSATGWYVGRKENKGASSC